MAPEYNPICIPVNNYVCLTVNKQSYSFGEMTYGQRLKLAREHAKLTQKELAEKLDNIVSQANISKLETSDAQGSIYTVQFATACGVRPEWLASEQGKMLNEFYASDERLNRAMVIMQEMPEYAIDDALKSLDTIIELTKKAGDDAKK